MRHAEVFEVGCREHEHLAGTVVTKVVRALLVFRALGPIEEILLLSLRLLGEQVVGQANGKLSIIRKPLDDGVIFGVILKAATGVDRSGDTQAVQLAHEMPGGVDLVVEWQLRPSGERRVEDVGVRLGQKKSCRIALGIPHDFAAWQLRRVLGVSNNPKSRAIQHGAIVEMQHEDRGIGRDRVELVNCRQTLLGELMLCETTDDPDPLWRRRDRDLPLQHGQGVGQRPDAIPPQFHVEVESAANNVEMIINQPRQYKPSLQVDDLGGGPGELHHIAVMSNGRK